MQVGIEFLAQRRHHHQTVSVEHLEIKEMLLMCITYNVVIEQHVLWTYTVINLHDKKGIRLQHMFPTGGTAP